MKEDDKRNLYRYLAVFFGFVLIALILLYIYLPKNCEYDKKCLNQAFANCERAKAFEVINSNTYLYEIKGSYKDYCRLNVKVMEISSYQQDIKTALENKGMLCRIPKSNTNVSIENVNNLLDYCTGPLKESMLELMIKRLYEVIISNIGQISLDMQNSITKTKTL